ncbi:MAG: DUF89 family protein [Candidatus Lokiarchaeota archaeon]|nr:DUF89 family protein [Candidatus Lokiarchaeota archaeon]
MTFKIWTLPECSSCLMKISYDIIEKSIKNESLKLKLFQKIFKILENFDSKSLTFDLANKIFMEIENNSEIYDPYLEIKKISNSISIGIIEKIKDLIVDILENNSFESFKKCLIMALVGNIIDFATGGHEFDLNEEYLSSLINESLDKDLIIDDSEHIYDIVKSGKKKIIYCLDNAGEIVFDKILIEKLIKLNNQVVAVVKNKPYSNDALIEDAIDVNLTKICKVIITERFGLGFINNDASEEFLNELNSCDMIISKGQNNFETFTFYREKFNKKIVFLLISKCKPLSKFLNTSLRSFIAKLEI